MSSSPVLEKSSEDFYPAEALHSLPRGASEPVFGDSPEDKVAERAFVRRLDLCFLTFGFLGYVFKYLDQSNISNAYVSGMKEDLKLNGNELNFFTTYFNIGYILMLYPSSIIISHFGPSVWLPSLEIIWGILTCTLSLVQNSHQVYGIRALIGFAEGSAWPAWFTLLSQWYLPHEVSFRMALYNSAQPVGAMISGVLQAALYNNLNGAGGRAGWRWLFIVNGLMTITVGLIGYTMIPGYPDRPNPLSKWWLSEESLRVARGRNARIKRAPQKPITLHSFIQVFKTWELWLFTIVWNIGGLTYPIQFFNLWLKSLKNPDGTATYRVDQLNYLPLGGHAINIVSVLIMTYLSDKTRKRLPFLLFNVGIGIFSNAILVARPANRSLYFAGYYILYAAQSGFLVLTAWISDLCVHSGELRTVLYASGTVVAYIFAATIPVAAWPAKEAPNWRVGSKLLLGTYVAVIPFYFAIRHLEKRDARRKLAEIESSPGTPKEG